ncbi:pyridoxal kinase [Limosilactobacillus fermentum]|uniref:PfkB family carbohydrate kinase n=1 Tax=Limosilactobacillus fermentum TaxID=1613 RepID=UPI001075FDB4|nr:PfkB family carbohydrate kinase [Limosilactobacillus fermentum]TFZ15159.1 pyridoxal kinase [Limosilactobacillus fermentum]
MKTLMVAEDLTALGQISLANALGVVQAQSVRPAMLPTTLLSTQSEGFGTPVALSTEEWLENTLAQWLDMGEEFAGILIGYVGQTALIDKLSVIIDHFALPVTVIDPVMGDRGSLYPGLDEDYVVAVRQLCQKATVITPNWTELCLLAGYDPTSECTQKLLDAMVEQLRQEGISARVIVTGILGQGTSSTAYQAENDDQFNWLMAPRIPGHFYGTGDLFSAILASQLVKDVPFERAIQVAHEGLRLAIVQTAPFDEDQRRYGLQLSHLLAYLTSFEA